MNGWRNRLLILQLLCTAALGVSTALAQLANTVSECGNITLSNDVSNTELLTRATDHFVQFFKRGGSRPVGSGFLASEDGHVITAYHVAKLLGRAEVTNPNVRVFVRENDESTTWTCTTVNAELIGYKDQYDVAVYRITHEETVHKLLERIEPFQLNDQASGVDQVLMMGPCAGAQRAGCFIDVTYDIKSRDGPYLYADQPVQVGFSGGPAIAEDGSIVGAVMDKNATPGSFESRILTMDAIDRVLWNIGIDLMPRYSNYPQLVSEIKVLLDELRYDLKWSARFAWTEFGNRRTKILKFSYTKRVSSGEHPKLVCIRLTPIVEGKAQNGALVTMVLDPIREEKYVPINVQVERTVPLELTDIVNKIDGQRSNFTPREDISVYEGVKSVVLELIPKFGEDSRCDPDERALTENEHLHVMEVPYAVQVKR